LDISGGDSTKRPKGEVDAYPEATLKAIICCGCPNIRIAANYKSLADRAKYL